MSADFPFGAERAQHAQHAQQTPLPLREGLGEGGTVQGGCIVRLNSAIPALGEAIKQAIGV